MISTSRERGFQAKQEDDTSESSKLISRPPPSSSRQWSGFRNPRIVRVSRSFGGKDRHSKVCTIRGLRDRRIRLSVPTAIQLYDLQDRLGLSQPSKVIDWLLDVTKNDIDKLPPLQIPQGLFGHQFHPSQMMLQSNAPTTSHHSLMTNSTSVDDHGDQDQSRYSWDLEAVSLMRANKGKEVERDHEDKIHQEASSLSAHHHQKFYPGLFNNTSNNNAMPLNPYYHWEPSNLSLSQFGSGHDFLSHQQAADQNYAFYSNAAAAAAAASLSHHHHLFFCPPAASATMPSLFPTYNNAPYVSNAQEGTSHDQSPRQMNHFQLLSSSSSSSSQSALHNNFFLPISSLAITSSSSQVKPFSLLNDESNPHEKEDS